MQSDIVQRLLRVKNRYDDGCSEHGKLANPDGPEAAAEIARLTEALRAAEEREKALRGAVGNIRAISAKRQLEGGPDETLVHIEGFARAALKEQPHD